MRGDDNMGCILVAGDTYLGMSKNNYVPVKDKDDARIFNDEKHAISMLQSNIPKILRKNYNWKTMEVEDVICSDSKINIQYTPVDIDDLKESIGSLSNKLSILKGNKEWLLEELSNIDKQICDVLHFLEFNSFSACEGYKLCKALKELRLKRREVKNELELINIVNTHSCNNIINGSTSKAIAGLETKQYAPRVLVELFEQRCIDRILSK